MLTNVSTMRVFTGFFFNTQATTWFTALGRSSSIHKKKSAYSDISQALSNFWDTSPWFLSSWRVLVFPFCSFTERISAGGHLGRSKSHPSKSGWAICPKMIQRKEHCPIIHPTDSWFDWSACLYRFSLAGRLLLLLEKGGDAYEMDVILPLIIS